MCVFYLIFFFFFNDTATTEIYTLSLHDALPISRTAQSRPKRLATSTSSTRAALARVLCASPSGRIDRKSTRLNSSHSQISYAVFCLKKKKKRTRIQHQDKSQVTYIRQQPDRLHC